MSTINDLPIPLFLQLTPQERFDLIRDCRAARRTPVVPAKTKSAPRARKGLDTQISNLTSEQAAQLLALLGDEPE